MDFHQVWQQGRHNVARLIQATSVHLIYCTSSGIKENEIRGIVFYAQNCSTFLLSAIVS